MTASLTKDRPRHAHLRFQDFVASRPDEEKWELIDGQFILQAQPNVDHQLIAGNLDRFLNDALERQGVDRVAVQNTAVDLRPIVDNHTYVPDVAVIDGSDIEPNRRVLQTCYLAAEIVSASDRRKPTGAARQKIAIKVENYETLRACETILLIEQAAFDVTIMARTGGGWTRQRLTGPEDIIVVSSIGLTYKVGDLYARTSLMRARKASAQ